MSPVSLILHIITVISVKKGDKVGEFNKSKHSYIYFPCETPSCIKPRQPTTYYYGKHTLGQSWHLLETGLDYHNWKISLGKMNELAAMFLIFVYAYFKVDYHFSHHYNFSTIYCKKSSVSLSLSVIFRRWEKRQVLFNLGGFRQLIWWLETCSQHPLRGDEMFASWRH